MNRYHEIIRVLARAGADIFAQDGHGMTPLAAAMMRSRWMAALELMRCGAEPRVRVCETEGGVTAVLPATSYCWGHGSNARRITCCHSAK